ncbi:MAG TPA: M14 family zinc carboxypeptidase, partial [Gemmatimonadales bacterium]|nr:M14 family zinc carboxypeptidase [Gemmatimonadales bacterium]
MLLHIPLLMTLLAQGADSIPTPASILGFPVGADFKLATYDESLRYFRALARSSSRIRLVDVGKTSTGGAWVLAIISSPANLSRLDTLRAISRRLAHPAGLSAEAARRLAREGKPFVDISGGLHASEIAGSQHT